MPPTPFQFPLSFGARSWVSVGSLLLYFSTQSHLLSSQPDLRAASALTLRHLAEQSAEALRPAEAAPLLFAALDRESDARIASEWKWGI